MNLNELQDTTRYKHKRQRVGRGPGSNRGKTCNRGQKGDKSRSGYKRRHGKEGGQLPLFQKLPTRGFSNAQFQIAVYSINLSRIDDVFEDGETVNRENLIAKGFPLRRIPKLKVLSGGELTKKVTIEAHSFSAHAEEKLKKQSIEYKVIA